MKIFLDLFIAFLLAETIGKTQHVAKLGDAWVPVVCPEVRIPETLQLWANSLKGSCSLSYHFNVIVEISVLVMSEII